MPDVKTISNLLPAGGQGMQLPPDVQAQIAAGQQAQRRAAEPAAPYSSRAAGMLTALEGGLGGLMEGSATRRAMQGQRDGNALAMDFLQHYGQGGGAAPSPMNTGAPGAGQRGIGSDHVAGRGPDDFLGRLGFVESGGRDGISNSASGATGRYQFIASTWNGLAQRYPELGLTPDGRTDPAQQQRAIQALTNENASALGRAGFQPTPGNLYLAHFAGPGGATAALRADPNTPVDEIMGGAAVRANPFLRGKTAGDLVAWANGKMAGVDPSSVPGAAPAPAAPAQAPAPSPQANASAASPAPAGQIGDGAAMAAQTRLRAGSGTDADRALYARYLQQQNTPQPARTASGDVPAPNAQPVGMQGLPPGVTAQMWAASQGPGADLHKFDEVPAGTRSYAPGQGGPSALADGLDAYKGPSPGPGLSGTVMRDGTPHELAKGASARADNGAAVMVSGRPGTTGLASPPAVAPEFDPEGTGAANYDLGPDATLRDHLEAGYAKQVPTGGAQPAPVPAPAPLGPGDKVLAGGFVEQPGGPSTLPGPLSGADGTAAQPAPVPPPAPLAAGDAVGPDGIVTPPSDGSLRGDLMAAMDKQGGGAQVPEPVGSFGDLPTPPSDLTGPQTDAAMGNDAGPSLRDTIAGAMDAPPGGPPSAMPASAPLPPPGIQSLQNAADVKSATDAAARPELDPEAVGLPGAEPSLRDQITSAMSNAAPAVSPTSGSPAPTPAAPASPTTQPGSVDDFGRTPDQAMAGAGGPAPAGTPSSAAQAGPAPAIGSPPAAGMGMLDPNLPVPQPASASGGSADLSKLAVGPLTPSYMAGLSKAMPNPDAPAPGAVQAGPAPVAGSPVAAAMGAAGQSTPSVPPNMLADAIQFGGSGTNAPAGNSPTSDPSSPQNFMLGEAARAGRGPAPGGLMSSIGNLLGPGSPQAGGTGLMRGAPAPGASPMPSAGPQQAPAPGPGGTMPAPAPGQGAPASGSGPDMSGGAGAGAGAMPYRSPAQASAPAATGPGGMSAEEYQKGMAVLNSYYASPEMKKLVLSRMFPEPEKISAGEGLVIRQPDGSVRNLYTQPGQDKFAYSPDGVHVLNKSTGQVTMPGADGSGGPGGWRPMTPTEMQRYGVTDGRPAYIAPNGEPHFGMPGTQGQGETEEAKESGKAAAGRQNDMLASANAAPMKIARLDLIGQVLDKTRTGPLAGEMGTAAAIASQAGISPERLAALGIDPNQAVNNAIANKLAGEMTMSSIGAKNGGMPASNFSVAERQFIEALYPNIENMPGANRMVIDVLKTAEQRNAQIASEWADYKDQQRGAGKALSYGDFEDSFRRAHAQENVFAPIIAKYQAGGYTPNALSPGGMPGAAPGGQGPAPTPQGGSPTASAAPPQGQAAPGSAYLPGAPWNVAPGVTGSPPAASQGGGGQGQAADPLSQARAAIAAGAPRAAVIQRLQGMGISATGL